MPSVLIAGLCAGSILALALHGSRILLPHPAFGAVPLVLSLLPALAALLVPRDPSGPGRGPLARLSASAAGTTAAAALLPAASAGIWLLTMDAAFIGQSAGAGTALLLVTWFGVFATLPVAVAVSRARTGTAAWGAESTGALVLGMAAGCWGMGSLAGAVDFRLALVVHALLCAVPLVRRPTGSTAADDSGQGPGLSDGSESTTRGPADARTGTRRTAAPASPAVDAAVMLLCAALPAWVAWVAQRALELGWTDDCVPLVIVPAALAALGLGLYSRLPLHDAHGRSTWLAVALPAAGAVGAAAALAGVRGSGWEGFYLDTVNERGVDLRLWTFITTGIVLPLFATGSVLRALWKAQDPQPASARRMHGSAASGPAHGGRAASAPARSATTRTAPSHASGERGMPPSQASSRASQASSRAASLPLRIGVAAAAGALLILLSVPRLDEFWLLGGAVAALAVATGAVASVRVHPVWAAAIALAVAGAFAWPLREADPPFRHFIPPARLQAVTERVDAAGRLSLFRARDDDDPFLAVMWNYGSPLTSDSRMLEDALGMYGHLPMLLAGRNGARVLVLGSGSGRVLERVAMHSPSSITCVEPLPALIRMRDSLARSRYLPPPSAGITWHAERVSAFAARSDAQWDVIIAPEPFADPHPTPALFTPRTYAHIATRLAPGGVFAQWLPAASMDPDVLRGITASFLTAFPHADAWLANADDANAMLCLTGSATAPSLPAARAALAELFERDEASFALRKMGVYGWEDVASRHIMSRAELDAWSRGADAPGTFDPAPPRGTRPGGLRLISDLLGRARPEPALAAGAPDSSLDRIRTMIATRPALLRAAEAFARGDDTSATTILFPITRAQPWNGEARRLFAEVLTRRAAMFVNAQQEAQAIPLLNEVVRLQPLNTLVLRLLMIASFTVGDREGSALAIDGIKRLNPRHASSKDNQATIRARQGGYDDALLLYENAITLDPTNEEYYCNMATLQFQLGRAWEAVRILDNAVARAWYPARALYLQGMFYAQGKRPVEALRSFEQYERIALPDDPFRAEVRRAISDLRRITP